MKDTSIKGDIMIIRIRLSLSPHKTVTGPVAKDYLIASYILKSLNVGKVK